MNTTCVRVLLDNSIVSAAELAEYVTEERMEPWGDIQTKIGISGFRKKLADDAALQEEIDAIVTIGRLIREGAVAAFTSSELSLEAFRRSARVMEFNALKGCHISTCPAPIERSRYRQTVRFGESIAKGGKKDKKRGTDFGDFNQIPYMEWLLSLYEPAVQCILAHGKEIGLPEFEAESFRQLDWFKFICSRVGSPENCVDAFHLWTAERNNMDVFLTMEKTLPNIVNQITKSKNHKYQIRTSVLRPIAFLQSLGISKRDDVPIKPGRFYDFMGGSH